MHEIFRTQIRQILGGRMKWLMGVALVLPVLLTFAARTAGGLAEIESELEEEQSRMLIAAGVLPEGMERVEWDGRDHSYLGGDLILTREGPAFHERQVAEQSVYIINDGYIVIRERELWIDPEREPPEGYLRIHHTFRRASLDGEEAVFDVTVQAISAGYLFLLYPQVVCLLLALLYGTSVLGHELDGKTLPYLFTRPLPRWQFVVGKYLGIVTSLALPTCLSLIASWLILGAFDDLSLIAALLTGTLGALLAYNAVFILFGFLTPRRGMIVALIYGIVFELILSIMPALVNQFTVTYYLRSMVVGLLDLRVPREIARMVGGASLPTSFLALAVIVALTLTLSATLAARREYVVKDEA